MLEKLDEAAAHHGGTVQLHGRLFGQWMHHAFPRECPFPHVAGATNPQTPDEWMEGKGQESLASNDEMRRYAEKQRPTTATSDVQDILHWTTEEELLVPVKPKSRGATRTLFSVVMFVAALISVASFASAPLKVAKAALENLSQSDEAFKKLI